MEYKTRLASIDDFEKGGVEIINDDIKNYVFSNIYEVASQNKPYERIVVAKNLDYTLEVARAEGSSPWYACSHDEYVIAMDYDVDLVFMELLDTSLIDDEKDGAFRMPGSPQGKLMGRVKLKRGHMALLPEKVAYQFSTDRASTILLQTIQGDESIQKWKDICLM